MQYVPAIVLVAVFMHTLANELTPEEEIEKQLPIGLRHVLDKASAAKDTSPPRRLLLSKKKEDVEGGLKRSPSILNPLRRDVAKSEVAKAVFNLVKQIVGAGVLSFPATIGAVGGEPMLVLPAILLVSGMGLLSSYTFFSIARICDIHQVSSYNNAWARSVGKRSSFLVSAIAIMYPTFCCLTYAIVIGDFFSSLVKGGFLGSSLASSEIATDRRTWTLGFTLAVLYPLCSFRKLAALGYTSLLGFMAGMYTTGFMVMRYLDGSYAPGGRFFDAAPALPSVMKSWNLLAGLKVFFTRPETLQLLAMCGGVCCPHGNAPSYYDSIGRDPAKLRIVILLGWVIGTFFNLLILAGGFLTFGTSANGVILNSYASTDQLAAVSRFLYGLAIVLTYPVIFAALKPVLTTIILQSTRMRDGVLLNQAITILPIVLITITSILIDDARIITAIRGSICGSSLIYIFPSLMYLGSTRWIVKNPLEIGWNIGLGVFGVLMMGLGLYSSFAAPSSPVTTLTTTTTKYLLSKDSVANVTSILL